MNDAVGDFSAYAQASAIQEKLTWPKICNRPVIVTEYGTSYTLNMVGKLDRRIAWYRTVHDIFTLNKISSTVFTFKGEIGPYEPHPMYQLWVQYLAAADQITTINGNPVFKNAWDREAAARNGFDSLLVKYLWKNGAVVPRSCLGSGPVLDELQRYFASSERDTSLKRDTGVLVLSSFSMPYCQSPGQNDIAAAKGWQFYGNAGVYKTGGFWYSIVDTTGSTAQNSSGRALDSVGMLDAVESGALHILLRTSTASKIYPWVFVGVPFIGQGNGEAFNLSELTSLVVRIKGTAVAGSPALGGGAATVRVLLRTDDITNAGDWGFYGYDITPTASYQTLCITPSQLKPEKYSAADDSGWTWEHGARAVRRLEFCVKSGTDAELWIDSIAFTGLDSSTFGFRPTPYSEPPVKVNAGFGAFGARAVTMKIVKGSLNIRYRVACRERVRMLMVDILGRQFALFDRIEDKGTYERSFRAPHDRIVILHIRIGDKEDRRVIPALR